MKVWYYNKQCHSDMDIHTDSMGHQVMPEYDKLFVKTSKHH